MITKYISAATVLIFGLSYSYAEVDNSSVFPNLKPVANSSEYKPHVGINLGMSDTEGDSDVRPIGGINVGFQPYVPFGIVGEYFIDSFENSDDDAVNRHSLMVSMNYNFGGTTPILSHSYVGVGVGPTVEDGTVYFATAPQIGFDLPLIEREDTSLTMGMQAKVLLTTGTSEEALLATGSVKYWY
ncbi:MAG: hypothetical protein CL677_07490 [Bdellovibrionaceae bacterium]|nr:hypothetical protein [Pseudobdellovibrionaceae bacterium]|tara:strand:+ start:45972 stop:46526 length:555 start_codon:yes stop_codon:yes gene_type:complete